ncbi:MAG: lysophospholipid acyltransferase family protein [Roseovarius sp.]
MQQQRSVRDISYADSAQTKGGRAVIRTMENLTGRMRLIKRVAGYDRDIAQGRDFWDVMVERYGLSLQVVTGSLGNIPKDKPLILVANHPYGILDGMMMGHILRQTRGDFKILANDAFCAASDLSDVILPISFKTTKEAVALNLATRKTALGYLEQGGAIGIFPGGGVATSARLFSKPMDPGWRAFTARMVSKSDAVVVPVFFEGQCSRLFQIASHLHMTLRAGLLIREFKARVDTPVRVHIGAVLGRDQLDPMRGDGKSLVAFLRAKTYELSPTLIDPASVGYKWD